MFVLSRRFFFSSNHQQKLLLFLWFVVLGPSAFSVFITFYFINFMIQHVNEIRWIFSLNALVSSQPNTLSIYILILIESIIYKSRAHKVSLLKQTEICLSFCRAFCYLYSFFAGGQTLKPKQVFFYSIFFCVCGWAHI